MSKRGLRLGCIAWRNWYSDLAVRIYFYIIMRPGAVRLGGRTIPTFCFLTAPPSRATQHHVLREAVRNHGKLAQSDLERR